MIAPAWGYPEFASVEAGPLPICPVTRTDPRRGSGFGERSVKLDAGSAVVYSASSTHRVNEVTRGERLVAVTWCQSMVRDAAQRELLYNLMLARDSLIAEDAEADTTRRVSNAYTNLVRMWAEV